MSISTPVAPRTPVWRLSPPPLPDTYTNYRTVTRQPCKRPENDICIYKLKKKPEALSKAKSMTPLFCRLNPAQKKKITQESISFTSGTRLIIVALSKYKYKVKSMTPLL
jgi:hypothetical protein